MKLTLSRREQQIILFVGFLVVVNLWLYVRFMIGPLIREAGSLRQQVQTAHDHLRTLEAITANAPTLQTQYHQVGQTVVSLREQLPSDEELPATIELLSNLASQTQVRIQSIFPQRTLGTAEAGKGASLPAGIAAPVVYKEIPIQIDAVAGYHQLGVFLSLVESQSRPIRITSLRISANPKEPRRHVIKLLLRSYFAASQPESTGQQG